MAVTINGNGVTSFSVSGFSDVSDDAPIAGGILAYKNGQWEVAAEAPEEGNILYYTGESWASQPRPEETAIGEGQQIVRYIAMPLPSAPPDTAAFLGGDPNTYGVLAFSQESLSFQDDLTPSLDYPNFEPVELIPGERGVDKEIVNTTGKPIFVLVTVIDQDPLATIDIESLAFEQFSLEAKAQFYVDGVLTSEQTIPSQLFRPSANANFYAKQPAFAVFSAIVPYRSIYKLTASVSSVKVAYWTEVR